jgi:Tfp pilus assembly protein PilO
MNLSKQKQVALLKLGVVTVLVLVALWFFLVHSAQTRLGEKANAANNLVKTIAAKKQVVERAGQTKAQIKESSQKLREIEDQMVAGDIYLWIEKTLRDFEIPDQIEFTKYDPPQIIEPEVPLKLPYKLASFTVSGSATYHDLGTFLANFENSYPHIRIRRLEMEPSAVGPGTKNEKLSFFFEMQVFLQPGNTSGSKPRL